MAALVTVVAPNLWCRHRDRRDEPHARLDASTIRFSCSHCPPVFGEPVLLAGLPPCSR
jgi:hypothetical protein